LVLALFPAVDALPRKQRPPTLQSEQHPKASGTAGTPNLLSNQGNHRLSLSAKEKELLERIRKAQRHRAWAVLAPVVTDWSVLERPSEGAVRSTSVDIVANPRCWGSVHFIAPA